MPLKATPPGLLQPRKEERGHIQGKQHAVEGLALASSDGAKTCGQERQAASPAGVLRAMVGPIEVEAPLELQADPAAHYQVVVLHPLA